MCINQTAKLEGTVLREIVLTSDTICKFRRFSRSILSFGNLLDGSRELTESYCTQDYGSFRERIQMKIIRGTDLYREASERVPDQKTWAVLRMHPLPSALIWDKPRGVSPSQLPGLWCPEFLLGLHSHRGHQADWCHRTQSPHPKLRDWSSWPGQPTLRSEVATYPSKIKTLLSRMTQITSENPKAKGTSHWARPSLF